MEKSKEACFACGKPGHFQKDFPSNKTSTPSYPSSNTSFNKPKPYTPLFTPNTFQKSSSSQKEYKGKYKGLKAEMVVLSHRIDELTKGKDDKGKYDKGKDDKRKNDEPSVGKGDARSALRGKGRKTENNSKEVLFTKADVPTSKSAPIITFDSKDGIDNQVSIPPLPKLTRAEPSGVSKSLISLSDLTVNMADLTLNTTSKRYSKESGPKVVFRDNSLGDTEGYDLVNCNGITFTRDHLGKFDEKADDGFFLGYSLVAKAFKVFSIRRQEMEETFHVTFSDDDEAISQTSTEVMLSTSMKLTPSLMMNSVSSIPNIKDVVIALDEAVHPESAVIESTDLQEDNRDEPIIDQILLQVKSPLADSVSDPPVPQDKWSREKHIELVNIIGEPLADITTRSRIRDSESASAHECLYVNFPSKIKPKKLIEALEEKDGFLP
nr:retrovirus-related Pol polyprotein from transposon TNT 1-94 [Tanacetum cinerariifolium]